MKQAMWKLLNRVRRLKLQDLAIENPPKIVCSLSRELAVGAWLCLVVLGSGENGNSY